MLKVFVSIVNFNGEKDTLNCLRSLNKLNTNNFELNVVVVDNGSKMPITLDKELYKNFKLFFIKSNKNLGFSGGHNLGIKMGLEKAADYVVILNNDVIAEKEMISEFLHTFNKFKDCAVVSPKIYFAKGHEYHKDRYKDKDLGRVIWFAGGETNWADVLAFHKGVDEVDNGQFEKEDKSEFASGCCMMIKKEVFERVGLFDEKYFLYYEDNDFSQRAKKNGFEIYFSPKAKLWHINAGSTGGSGSFLQDYYITRNRLIFGFKYANKRAKFAILRESIKLLINGRKWQKQGVIDFYLRKFGKGSFV